jgi:hypothetical protein
MQRKKKKEKPSSKRLKRKLKVKTKYLGVMTSRRGLRMSFKKGLEFSYAPVPHFWKILAMLSPSFLLMVGFCKHAWDKLAAITDPSGLPPSLMWSQTHGNSPSFFHTKKKTAYQLQKGNKTRKIIPSL